MPPPTLNSEEPHNLSVSSQPIRIGSASPARDGSHPHARAASGCGAFLPARRSSLAESPRSPG